MMAGMTVLPCVGQIERTAFLAQREGARTSEHCRSARALYTAAIDPGDLQNMQRSSAAVAKADACDAAGNHAEAVNQLALGARDNDVEAITRLGKRLLVGDRAPHMPNDGARLLEDAVALGGAEAAALVAVLYALGASLEHGLAAALERLTLAAERGWLPAQAQLRILAAEHPGGGTLCSDTKGDDWQRFASHVDLQAWQRFGPSTDLSTSPLVRLIPGFLNASVCRWIMDRASGHLTRALVYDALARRTMVHETRTNTAATLNLLDTDFVCVLAQIRMAACYGIPLRQLEPISILHYDEGEEITEHFDFVDPKVPNYREEIATKGQRVVTFLVYLNDDYAGGETAFPRLGIEHKGHCGDGLFFVNALPDGSSDVRTLHAGRPPSQGVKWIIAQFIRDRFTL